MKPIYKNSVIATALILLMAFATVMALVPGAQAATPVDYDTFAFVTANPNPVGVGQMVVVTYRIDKAPPTASGGDVGDRWQNFQVTITKPDGNTEVKTGLSSDATGGGYFLYYPATAGNYTFQASFPGQWINASDSYGMFGFVPGYSRWYKPSTSAVQSLTVQEDPITSYPDVPLPTGYWTRPIYGENKGWWQISGNWLMDGYDYVGRSFAGYTAFAPYNAGPETSHIMWTNPIAFGGIIGGSNFGDNTYYTGLAYEQLYTPLILQGRIVYTTSARPPGYGTWCVDLRTGEDIWYINDTINMAQVYDYNSQNQHGGLAYLWVTGGGGMFGAPTSTWKMYDAFTGRYIMSIANVTTGTTVFGSDGSILNYRFTGNVNYSGIIVNQLTLWNSSEAISPWDPNGMQWWRPTTGSTIDGNRGIMWTKNLTAFGAGGQDGPLGFGMSVNPALKRIGFDENGNPSVLLAGWGDNTAYPWTLGYAAYSLKQGQEGRLLWNRTINNLYGVMGERLSQNIGDGVFTLFDEPTEQLHIFSITTGEEVATTPSFGTGWGLFTRDYHIAYGNVYTAGYDGYVRAYSVTDGSLKWEYYFGSSGYENAYGTYPVYNGFTIADGKIYIANDEHSPDGVLWRGGSTVCLDASTGDLIWKLSGWLRIPVVADGYLTAVNAYDNQIYSIGKGPSQTTVEAPLAGVSAGSPVTITGTVTDQSTGAKDTPCISDADMTAWMEYLYQQKPMPTDAKGVDVTISVVGPDGTTTVLGNTTSDIGGSFGYSWTPTTEGKYQIIASFDGTNAYGSSYATTYMTVGSASTAPSSTVTPTPTPTEVPTSTPTETASPSPYVENPEGGPNTALYVAAASIAIIAVVAAVALVLRRRK